MNIIKGLLDLFIPKTVDELKKDYIRKNGYPDEDVILVDKWGNFGKIIGKNTFARLAETLRKVPVSNNQS